MLPPIACVPYHNLRQLLVGGSAVGADSQRRLLGRLAGQLAQRQRGDVAEGRADPDRHVRVATRQVQVPALGGGVTRQKHHTTAQKHRKLWRKKTT